jgi:hypothetical protein
VCPHDRNVETLEVNLTPTSRLRSALLGGLDAERSAISSTCSPGGLNM